MCTALVFWTKIYCLFCHYNIPSLIYIHYVMNLIQVYFLYLGPTHLSWWDDSWRTPKGPIWLSASWTAFSYGSEWGCNLQHWVTIWLEIGSSIHITMGTPWVYVSNKTVTLCFNMSPLMTKPSKWSVHPAKTQISPGIRPVWSESSLSALRNSGSSATHWAHNEDWSDWADAQADLSICWVHSHFVGNVMSRLMLSSLSEARNSESPEEYRIQH